MIRGYGRVSKMRGLAVHIIHSLLDRWLYKEVRKLLLYVNVISVADQCPIVTYITCTGIPFMANAM